MKVLKFFCMVLKIVVLVGVLALLVPASAYFVVKVNARNKNFVNVSNVPYNKVGLVLGTSPTMPSGRPNYFFPPRKDK